MLKNQMYKYNYWIIKDFLCRLVAYNTPGVHRDDHDFASYYTFSLAVANDAENAQTNRVCRRAHDQSTDLCRFSAPRLQNSINLRHCFILSSESVAETTELLSSVWLGSVVVVAQDLRYKMAANSTPGHCLAEQRATLGKSFTRVQFPAPLKLKPYVAL